MFSRSNTKSDTPLSRLARNRKLCILTVQKIRRMQPLLVRIIFEHPLPAFQVVHHLAYDTLAYRRTAMAAADTAVITHPGGIHVVGAVYNNRPFPGEVVETRLKTIEA